MRSDTHYPVFLDLQEYDLNPLTLTIDAPNYISLGVCGDPLIIPTISNKDVLANLNIQIDPDDTFFVEPVCFISNEELWDDSFQLNGDVLPLQLTFFRPDSQFYGIVDNVGEYAINVVYKDTRYGLDASASFVLRVVNQPPIVIDVIPDFTQTVGYTWTLTLVLEDLFLEPEGELL